MKKFLVLLMLILAVCSSTFAKNETGTIKNSDTDNLIKSLDAMQECKLNLDRWLDAGMPSDYSFFKFFDKETIISNNPEVFEVWVCDYHTGIKPCTFEECKKAKIENSKHYHYARIRYNASAFTFRTLSLMIKDSQNEKIIKSITIPPYIQNDNPIPPESMAEGTLIEIRKYLQNKKKSK